MTAYHEYTDREIIDYFISEQRPIESVTERDKHIAYLEDRLANLEKWRSVKLDVTAMEEVEMRIRTYKLGITAIKEYYGLDDDSMSLFGVFDNE